MGKVKLQRKISDFLSKPTSLIRKQKVKQRQNSLLSTIRGFLAADSFMYGPLFSKTYDTPGIRYITGTDREKRSRSNSPVKNLKDTVNDSEEPIQQVIDDFEAASEASGQIVRDTYVSVRKTIKTTTILADDVKGDAASSLLGVLHHDPATPKPVDTTGDAELTEGEADEEHSWDNEGHEEEDFHDHIPLDEGVAEKVANQLIGGLGGRFSDDLGINVDISDNEVECWFLAANFFSRSVPFDVSKNTYKELREAGVSKVTDLLNLEEGRLAAIVEKTGYTKYGQRVATWLQKLATLLEANYWGRISTFKHAPDNQELTRQLRSLPGVKLIATRIFLRELRGVWKGAGPEFDLKTKRAAMHLKLLGSIKASSYPERVLSEFTQFAGIDLRDLEVALFKLGSEHEQQYSECPGGSDCTVLPLSEKLTEKLIDTLPSDILL